MKFVFYILIVFIIQMSAFGMKRSFAECLNEHAPKVYLNILPRELSDELKKYLLITNLGYFLWLVEYEKRKNNGSLLAAVTDPPFCIHVGHGLYGESTLDLYKSDDEISAGDILQSQLRKERKYGPQTIIERSISFHKASDTILFSVIHDIAVIRQTKNNAFVRMHFACNGDIKSQLQHIYGIHSFLQGHTKRIEHVGFSERGDIALSTSQDGTARIWDLNKLTCLQVVPYSNDNADIVMGLMRIPQPLTVQSAQFVGENQIITTPMMHAALLWKLFDLEVKDKLVSQITVEQAHQFIQDYDTLPQEEFIERTKSLEQLLKISDKTL